MRKERRSRWYLWTCDNDGCGLQTTTHPSANTLPAVESEDIPPGWIVIDPPPFWRGPSLSFHSTACRNEWAQATVGPLLLGDGAR